MPILDAQFSQDAAKFLKLPAREQRKRKYYIYTVKDDTGKVIHGLMEARDKRFVKQKLRHSQLYFLGARPYQERKIFSAKIDLEALLMFTHRLASMVGSGIPILSAMHILWRQTEDQTLQLVISHIYRNLEEGEKISTVLKDFPGIFPPMYVALIGVAEQSGGLVYILNKLTEYLKYQKDVITRTKKATLYPMIVTAFAVLVLMFMFVFVVPTFQKVLSQLKVELPFLTQIILNISQMLRSGIFIVTVFIVVAAFFVLYLQLRRMKPVSYFIDEFKLKIPFIGGILYNISVSRFVRSLSILLAAGLPLLESFQISKTVADNKAIIRGIERVQKKVEGGSPLNASFKEAGIFPVMLIEMVGVGEASGTIVQVLENLANHFDEEVDYKLNRFFTILEPLLIIFVGSIVIVTLLAIYLPIFTIWNSLAG